MASCHAWNQPSGNVAVEKKKNLWGFVSKRVVAMVMQCQAGRESWMLVSMGHRMSDRAWSSQGCNERYEMYWRASWWASMLHPSLGIYRILQAPFHMQMSVFNCCSAEFPTYERKRGNASEDVYSNEIFKGPNEIFCQFGVSMGDSSSGAAFKRSEAGCFNDPLGSLSQPSKLCLFV